MNEDKKFLREEEDADAGWLITSQMSFSMHSGCLTVNPGCLTNSPVPLTISPGLLTAGSGFLTAGSGCFTTNQLSLTMTSGPLTKSSGWVFFEIKGMVFSVLYWFTGGVCHFLCLETKKVTKENSRTKEWLRPFVRPTHQWQMWRRSFVWAWQMSGAINWRLCFMKCREPGGAVFRLVFI